MVFERRPLAGPDTLGQRLRQLREDEGNTYEDLSRELGIGAKYLQAIEEGRYQDLPGPVYARNFVRRYAERMNLEVAAAMDRFEKEYSLVSAVRPATQPLIRERVKTDLPWWRRNLRLLFAGAAVAVVLGYFSWQVFNLFRPPELIVSDPAADLVTTESQITVRGQTDPGASVTINRQAVEVNVNGQFSDLVELKTGLNMLRIAAQQPRSGERVVTRNILVEEKP